MGSVNSYGAYVVEDGCVLMVSGAAGGLSFPKGHIEPGESPKRAAEREVLEETGIAVEVDTSRAWIVPSATPGDKRSVTFYLARSLEGRKEPVPHEVREALWVPLDQAADRVKFGPDRTMWRAALIYWRRQQAQAARKRQKR